MKWIPIANSKKRIKVDDEDYAELSRHRWALYGHGYVYATVDGEGTSMHRYLTRPPKGMVVDHINSDKLDNRRTNLRVCTLAQNNIHRPGHRNSTSRFKGVSWRTSMNKWRAQICVNRNITELGHYRTEEEAAAVYNVAAQKYHGEFAQLNQINR